MSESMHFIDLHAQYSRLQSEIDASIHEVLSHGKYIMGPEVAALEAQLCRYVGVKHCITCANGTDALMMLFMAYGIAAGDAVFCPDVTFFASVESAYLLGATPVLCDIAPDTYNISIKSLENQIEAVIKEGKLTPRAVVAVDLFGNPADYDALNEICERYGMILIEDAAQSFGSEYKNKKAGSFGHSAITSFFPSKPLGCYGDGGAIFTNHDDLAERCRSIRIHGKGPRGKYDNVRVGLNSRLDTLQAAILLVKLQAFEAYELKERHAVAERYHTAFAGHYTLPFISPDCSSAWALYVLLASDEGSRNRVTDSLQAKQIPYMIYYPNPMHKLPVFDTLAHYTETFPVATDFCQRTISLPMHPYLDTAQQDVIINAVLAG